ncbi:MAG: cytochrome P450 [Proteobacteria bacterium]|nr:cytochrome P450 [Pseudomonadota bacterium]
MKLRSRLPGAGAHRRFDVVQARAALVSLFRRTRLPPGDKAQALDVIEKNDRLALLRMAVEVGPVFKGRGWGSLWIYVVGLPRCRQILRAHEDDLHPVTIDVGTLFDKGILRQMEGDDHRRYRSALVQAIGALPADRAEGQVSRVGHSLKDMSGLQDAAPMPVQTFKSLLARIVLDELAHVIFGVEPGEPAHDELVAAYGELGGNGLVWNIGTRQARAYAAIAAILRRHSATTEARGPASTSVLANLLQQGPVDAVMLGNLIYMVEMGRYDMAAFFRWLTWFAAMHQDWMQRIAEATDTQQAVAAAFVMEALRLEQSERLVRRVKRDFVAEGFLFPKGANVRFCIWESHKSPDAHAEPFSFDPGRFLGERPGPDRYSPFGIDRHQCPFGAYSIRLAAAFVTALATHFHIGLSGSGAPVRGLYHWEPAEDFSPVFTERKPRSTNGSRP